MGVGYLDKEAGDYYNRYMIVGPEGVCGVVSKSVGESAVFKRGNFGHVISTPFGNVGVGICYDARRRHFYENVKNQELSLILFPHGSPADPTKPLEEKRTNDFFCSTYVEAFGVPVVYVNSKGKLEHMPGKMGAMMEKEGFAMNGRSKIYCAKGSELDTGMKEALGVETNIAPQRLKKRIRFYGEDLIKGNWFFRNLILKPDTAAGIKSYEANR